MRKLYLRNLRYEVEVADIEDAFKPFGEIVRCDVPKDQDNPNKCKG